jgi:hypothetical protein
MLDIETKEQQRLVLQAHLDGEKTKAQRNRLGQFATPTVLARDILQYANTILGEQGPIRFLDPALGTGSFYSAFLHVFGENVNHHATGFEIDSHYGSAAEDLWENHAIEIRHEDFTKAALPNKEAAKATLLICNPPYVRHHHIQSAEKKRLNSQVARRCGILLSGLSGLYGYFMCLSKDWMAQGGLAAWLIPSEFMDVNYGTAIKAFLLNNVSLLHIHRFRPDDVQFGDALVSSAVVWFRNEPPKTEQTVTFSLGGSLNAPLRTETYPVEELKDERKWTSLPRIESHHDGCGPRSIHTMGDFFTVKRGIATGANDFFVLSLSEVQEREIPSEFLTPILPSPRYLREDWIDSDDDGIPDIDKCSFVFSTDMPESRIKEKFPKVWRYLEEGRRRGIAERYLCRNRMPWYTQEKRKPAPLLCTYMGRTNGKNGRNGARPFRFIRNRSKAIAANVYLMLYPKPRLEKSFQENPEFIQTVWQALRDIPVEVLIGEGRVYGGGLHKLEPKELLNTPLKELSELFATNAAGRTEQLTLF